MYYCKPQNLLIPRLGVLQAVLKSAVLRYGSFELIFYVVFKSILFAFGVPIRSSCALPCTNFLMIAFLPVISEVHFIRNTSQYQANYPVCAFQCNSNTSILFCLCILYYCMYRTCYFLCHRIICLTRPRNHRQIASVIPEN